MATTLASGRHEAPLGRPDGLSDGVVVDAGAAAPKGVGAAHRTQALSDGAGQASEKGSKSEKKQASQPAATVRDQLLEQALDLICKRGFNGFSYRDLAERVGVKTSSIHYYFPTKEDLALAAVQEYAARVARHIEAIDPGLPPQVQAERYLEPWREGLKTEKVCVAGMLASEALCLPESVHSALQAFQGMNESWLAGLLRRAHRTAGGTDGAQGTIGTPEALAQILFAALQNGQVSARLFGSTARLEPAAQLLLTAAGGAPQAAAVKAEDIVGAAGEERAQTAEPLAMAAE